MAEKNRYSALCIVIPVYNEGGNIRQTIREIEGKIRTPHDILVVYDFEEDDTLPAVREMIMEGLSNMRLVRNKYGRGVLNAIKTGFESAGEGAVLVVMADLSDDLAVVDTMFKRMNEGSDIVCGSRYMKGGRQVGGPLFKKMLSRAAGVSLHYLAGLPTRDVTNSFKMYSKEVLDNIRIESGGGFELGMEIVVKAHFMGYKISEVPSTWQDRVAGESRFMLRKWLPKYLHWYFFAIRSSILPGAAKKFRGTAQ